MIENWNTLAYLWSSENEYALKSKSNLSCRHKLSINSNIHMLLNLLIQSAKIFVYKASNSLCINYDWINIDTTSEDSTDTKSLNYEGREKKSIKAEVKRLKTTYTGWAAMTVADDDWRWTMTPNPQNQNEEMRIPFLMRNEKHRVAAGFLFFSLNTKLQLG